MGEREKGKPLFTGQRLSRVCQELVILEGGRLCGWITCISVYTARWWCPEQSECMKIPFPSLSSCSMRGDKRSFTRPWPHFPRLSRLAISLPWHHSRCDRKQRAVARSSLSYGSCRNAAYASRLGVKASSTGDRLPAPKSQPFRSHPIGTSRVNHCRMPAPLGL